MIGIYKITSPSGKTYIGQSSNIEKRKIVYKKINCKGQLKLYNSLKKYGFDKHKFDVLCECEILELNDKERYYQDLYSSIGKNGLNLKLTKSNDRKCQISEETKLKISVANKIINAKKRGDFNENTDYSVYTRKTKIIVIRKKYVAYYKNNIIFFPYTGEYFGTIMCLFKTHRDKFLSYEDARKTIKINSVKKRFITLEELINNEVKYKYINEKK